MRYTLMLFPLVAYAVNLSLVECFCDCPRGFECFESLNGNFSCVECIDGLTYEANGTCVQCSECLLDQSVCNTTNDAVCGAKCDRGLYWNRDTKKCENCRLCPHGYGAMIPCSPSNDAVCLQCPFGYFSDILSSSRDCVQCAVCKNDESIAHNCSSIQDTICIGRKVFSVRKSVQNDDKWSFGEGLLPFYCTLLSAVIFGLILYVLVKKWLISRRKHHKLPTFDDQHDCNLFDAPKCKLIQVEKLLNPHRMDKRDWTALARQFGYNSMQIAYIQKKFRDAQGGCARELIAQLSKNGVTVDTFFRGLILIGRADAASIFQPNLLKPITRDLKNRDFI